MGLKEAIQNVWSSDYVQKNPTKAYKTAYAAEYAAVAAYLNGGAEPVWQNFSKLGKGLCEAEKHRRAEVPVPPPSGWTKVADEHQSFTLPAAKDVRFGKNQTWVTKSLAAGTYVCNTATFGSDPVPGTPKECQTGGASVPVPPEPLPPDPPTGAKPLVGNITAGGTYTGAFSGNVTISTTQPVIIDGAMGDIRFSFGSGADLTIRRCRITGPDAWNSPRWVTGQEWKRLVIENNTITNTRGIELSPNRQPNPTTVITRNLHRNIKGTTDQSLGEVGNFVQFRVIWGGDKWASDQPKNPNPGTLEVSWNHIINEHNKSNPEDVFSIYKTARTRIHDNLIEGQTKPDSFSTSSQNSITVDPADEAGLLYDNQILRNFVIDAYSIGMFGGNNNLFEDNYVVSDGYMGDTGQRMKWGYSGMFIGTNGTGNKAIQNHVGYVNGTTHGSTRVDYQQDAGEWTGNVSLPNPITRQTELDHIGMWKQRVAAAGLTIGA